MKLLKELLSKNNVYICGQDHSKAMKAGKDIITGPQCLARFDPDNPSVLIIDARRIGLGFILVQPKEIEVGKAGLMTTSPNNHTVSKIPKGKLIVCS